MLWHQSIRSIRHVKSSNIRSFKFNRSRFNTMRVWTQLWKKNNIFASSFFMSLSSHQADLHSSVPYGIHKLYGRPSFMHEHNSMSLPNNMARCAQFFSMYTSEPWKGMSGLIFMCWYVTCDAIYKTVLFSRKWRTRDD